MQPIDMETPELTEFEGENLGDLITNLLTEVKRLRARYVSGFYAWMLENHDDIVNEWEASE